VERVSLRVVLYPRKLPHPGLEPGLVEVELSAQIMRPPHLPPTCQECGNSHTTKTRVKYQGLLGLGFCNGFTFAFIITRDKFTRAQKRKSGAFRSAAVIMNELQRNIDGWEVRQCTLITLLQGWTPSDSHKACGENPVQSWVIYLKAGAA